MCTGEECEPTAVILTSRDRHNVSSPLPMQVDKVVIVDVPRLVDEGTSRWIVNSLFSPGSNVIEYTLFKPLLRTGVPPQDGFVQSIDVVVSWALPRFSIIT